MRVLDIRVLTLLLVLLLKAANGNAQSLSLDQLVSVHKAEYFSDIDIYMRKLEWVFDDGQVHAGEEADEFAWVHRRPDGSGNDDATLIVVFCKNSHNKSVVNALSLYIATNSASSMPSIRRKP